MFNVHLIMFTRQVASQSQCLRCLKVTGLIDEVEFLGNRQILGHANPTLV